MFSATSLIEPNCPNFQHKSKSAQHQTDDECEADDNHLHNSTTAFFGAALQQTINKAMQMYVHPEYGQLHA